MKRQSSVLLTIAILAPFITGLSLQTFSHASYAKESSPQTEGRHTRGKNLSPEEREAKMAEKAAKMKEYLNLSDSQAAEIESIRDKYQPQRQALKAEGDALKGSGDPSGKSTLRQKMMDLRQQIKSEIKAVLTSEQLEKLEAFESERQGRKGRGIRPSSEG